MKNKGLWLLGGYTLLTLGVTSIVMQVVGVHWVFLGFLEWGGRLFSFVVKIAMVLAGVLMIVFSRTDWEQERIDSEEQPAYNEKPPL